MTGSFATSSLAQEVAAAVYVNALIKNLLFTLTHCIHKIKLFIYNLYVSLKELPTGFNDKLAFYK